MLYMDIDDLQTHAVNDLNEILQASDNSQLTGDTNTKFYILTGGKKVEKGKTDVNLHGNTYTDFYSNTKSVYTFTTNSGLIFSTSNNPDYSNIKNDFHIWGRNDNDYPFPKIPAYR